MSPQRFKYRRPAGRKIQITRGCHVILHYKKQTPQQRLHFLRISVTVQRVRTM